MKLGHVLAVIVTCSATAAFGDVPTIQSPSPVIYLADNLDEADNLGWCIDTLGRGWSERLQAHSCKPQGGDTQFQFDVETGTIRSVEFPGKCMTLSTPENESVPFGLLDCDPGSESQSFVYDATSMEYRLATQPSQCVVVAATSRSAGPFMSRDLQLSPCADIDPSLKQWVIRE